MPAYHPQRIEPKWQNFWDEHKTFKTRDLVPGRPKLYILDMFPYPSGSGLHVGHPEGYTATDILCRFKRMRGFNVLHPMGWDAFGLPAEQFAIRTGTHPKVTTKANVDNFRRQIKSLGFSYDWDREVDTTDPGYYKWTQWIFLQLFDTWYDPDHKWVDQNGHARTGKGRPIAELPIPPGTSDPNAYRDSKRLAYRAEVPVNWCPELGTVLANEEVVDGKSEVGGFRVVRMPLKQWMLRITAYADRLADDIEAVDWPRPIKDMQRNWIGRSEGAEVDFPIDGVGSLRVFTTRPDTLFGATYMVVAPEHPLVESLTVEGQREAVTAYRETASRKSDLDRTDLAKSKTGVFTGSYATNPVNGRQIPVWVADYVLMGYGTGAIMAVPGHDDRDFEFATTFDLPIVRVVARNVSESDFALDTADTELGVAVNSRNDDIQTICKDSPPLNLDGMPTPEAKSAITAWLEGCGFGTKAVNTKLRDWLFSRQRYWGEPFPILLGADGSVVAVDEAELPVLLPELDDFRPSGRPEPPLGKATDWVNYSEAYRRETNTMPQWAGSCWYYLRYIDPRNDQQPFSPELEKYWLPVDLYVGGAEHAVLHLLYSRFWHKVMFDRGLVSTPEPFQKLVNQGMILGETEYTGYRDHEGDWVSPSDVFETDGAYFVKKSDPPRALQPTKLSEDAVVKKGEGFVLATDPTIRIDARAHKMSKSRGNVITPDLVVDEYGADSLRLYEMFMGPLEAVKPWSMKGVEGVYRFLARAWRLVVAFEEPEVMRDPKVQEVEPSPAQARVIAKTIAGVTDDLEGMRFNTAISKLMEFVNVFTSEEVRPVSAMKTFTLLLAPMAPHLAEELWQLLGGTDTLAYEPWPDYDASLLVDEQLELPVQINGKVKSKIVVANGIGSEELEVAARSDPKMVGLLQGKTIRKVIVVPGKMVNFVVG
jgi:leucyl-tRNA synthetase